MLNSTFFTVANGFRSEGRTVFGGAGGVGGVGGAGVGGVVGVAWGGWVAGVAWVAWGVWVVLVVRVVRVVWVVGFINGFRFSIEEKFSRIWFLRAFNVSNAREDALFIQIK
jgi:hypothetical protein